MPDTLHIEPCGCRVERDAGGGVHIDFCALHAAVRVMHINRPLVGIVLNELPAFLDTLDEQDRQVVRELLKLACRRLEHLTPASDCDILDSDQTTSADE